MKKNTGKEYEKLIETVFKQILFQESVKTIKIERNFILQSKSTRHEIDIYWSFKVGNTSYETILQVKDEINKISKGKILQFKQILDDLPNQPRGIFVTKNGYQSGAIEVAAFHGIELYTFRKSLDDDFKDRIKEIEIEGNIFEPKFDIISFKFDKIWLSNKLRGLGINKGETMSISIKGLSNEIGIYNYDGILIYTLYDLGYSLVPSGFKSTEPQHVTHTFNEEVYINTPHLILKMVKINSIDFLVQVLETKIKLSIKAGELVAFILENTIKGDRKYFGHNLNLI